MRLRWRQDAVRFSAEALSPVLEILRIKYGLELSEWQRVHKTGKRGQSDFTLRLQLFTWPLLKCPFPLARVGQTNFASEDIEEVTPKAIF